MLAIVHRLTQTALRIQSGFWPFNKTIHRGIMPPRLIPTQRFCGSCCWRYGVTAIENACVALRLCCASDCALPELISLVWEENELPLWKGFSIRKVCSRGETTYLHKGETHEMKVLSGARPNCRDGTLSF